MTGKGAATPHPASNYLNHLNNLNNAIIMGIAVIAAVSLFINTKNTKTATGNKAIKALSESLNAITICSFPGSQ